MTDKRVLRDLDVQSYSALFGPPINSHRASIYLPPFDDVREFMFTDHPWLAADPTLGPWPESADLDVVCAGARGSCRTNVRSRPGWWRSWTPAHHPCTWD